MNEITEVIFSSLESLLFYHIPKVIIFFELIFRERGRKNKRKREGGRERRGRKRKRETSMWETPVNCLPQILSVGIKPTTWECAWPGIKPAPFWCAGSCSNPLSHPARAQNNYFLLTETWKTMQWKDQVYLWLPRRGEQLILKKFCDYGSFSSLSHSQSWVLYKILPLIWFEPLNFPFPCFGVKNPMFWTDLTWISSHLWNKVERYRIFHGIRRLGI